MKERQSGRPMLTGKDLNRDIKEEFDDGAGEDPRSWMDKFIEKHGFTKNTGLYGSAALALFAGLVPGSALAAKPGIVVEGEMPSQAVEISTILRDEVEKKVKDIKIEAPSVPREVIMDLMKQYDQDNLGKYYQELKEYGCTDSDRLESCAKWLNSTDDLDVYLKDHQYPESTYISNYVLRNKILEYSVSGEGLNVYNNEENKPRFLIGVQGDNPGSKSYQKGVDKITKNFKAAFDYMKQNGIDNAVEAMWENGFNTFYACNFDEGDYTMGTFFEGGVIMGNFDAGIDKKDFQMMRNFCRLLLLESNGVGILRLNSGAGIFSDLAYVELVKGIMSGDNWEYLYKIGGKKNEELWFFMTDGRSTIDSFLNKFRKSPQDPLLKKLYEELTRGNLLRPIGAKNWQVVMTQVEETPESRPWLK